MKKSKLLAGYLLGIAAAYIYTKSQEENEEDTQEQNFFDYVITVHKNVFCYLEKKFWTSKNRDFLNRKKDEVITKAQEYKNYAQENWKEYLQKGEQHVKETYKKGSEKVQEWREDMPETLKKSKEQLKDYWQKRKSKTSEENKDDE